MKVPNGETLYFKIMNGVVEGQEYYGLFISPSKDIEPNMNTFKRGWEIEKLTPEIKAEFEIELRRDARGCIEVES